MCEGVRLAMSLSPRLPYGLDLCGARTEASRFLPPRFHTVWNCVERNDAETPSCYGFEFCWSRLRFLRGYYDVDFVSLTYTIEETSSFQGTRELDRLPGCTRNSNSGPPADRLLPAVTIY